MLRALKDHDGMYFLDRSPLDDQVLGEETWLCCQGVLRIGSAWALRCQWTMQREPGGVRQQCGNIATRAPDGEALCEWHCQEAWFCYQCDVPFATKYGDMRWEVSFCHGCAVQFFRCERCDTSCPERLRLLTSYEDQLLCVGCAGGA